MSAADGNHFLPLSPVLLSFLLTLLVFGLAVWALWRDREFWRVQYQREREAREHLFQQGILRSGGRTPDQPLQVTRQVVERPVLSHEERTFCENVVAEAASSGRITHTEGTRILGEMNAGRLNRKGLDELVAKWQRAEFQGSVLDI